VPAKVDPVSSRGLRHHSERFLVSLYNDCRLVAPVHKPPRGQLEPKLSTWTLLTSYLGIGATAIGSLSGLALDTAAPKEKSAIEVAESWEDETEEADDSALFTTISIPFFPNLTRLSLAHPGATASWTDLLAISVHLNTLTHLSLAYWPRPSTTPNAATTSMVSRHATVSLGGSHFYSDLDDDWHEAANILRRLSLNTYCLKYLDLEGCSWIKALTWNMSTQPSPNDLSSNGDTDEWVRTLTFPGPDWNAAWRQIERINLFQGWIPAHLPSLQALPAGVVAIQLMQWLRDDEKQRELQDKGILDSGRTSQDVIGWVEREKIGRWVEQEIMRSRRGASEGGLWVHVEYGWGK
jgi:hypothetical protein